MSDQLPWTFPSDTMFMDQFRGYWLDLAATCNDPQFEGSFNTCNTSSLSQATIYLDGSGDINNMIYATGIPNQSSSSILQHERGAQNCINGQDSASRGVIPPRASTPTLPSQDTPQARFSVIGWPQLIDSQPEYYPIGPQDVLMTDSPTSTPTSAVP
ncbi:hypothetical protein BGX34_005499, partial [Mortierella sp. NVP85]